MASGGAQEDQAEILVTNDDGIWAAGLRQLARGLREHGHGVVVVAPEEDASGSGTGLRWPKGGSLVASETVEAGVRYVGIAGTPALAVLAGMQGLVGGRPRCVVVGVNHGSNTGREVLHSGTVGAALTAANYGASALAISIDSDKPRHLDTAVLVARRCLAWLRTARKRTVLNVNVPDVQFGRVQGLRAARLAVVGRDRLVFGSRHRAADGTARIAAGTVTLDPQSDAGLLAAGFVPVTLLRGVTAVPSPEAATELEWLLEGGDPE
jgi:5'-nucleotidase